MRKVLKICKRCNEHTKQTYTGLCYSCAENPAPIDKEYNARYIWVTPEEYENLDILYVHTQEVTPDDKQDES